MRKLISIVLSILCVVCLKAQIQKDYIRPVESSPAMAELARYGNVPVSLSSGTVNISVPIYNFRCGPLNIPVALSYNGSGIRVNQIASNIGLGWSLNAGGVINAEIIGHSDMSGGKRVIHDAADFSNKNYPAKSDMNLITSPIVNMDTTKNNNYIDSQPDMFSFNFQGYSGNFILDKDLKAYMLNDTRNLNIIPNTTNNSFTITDNEGTIYEFTSHEKTKRTTYYKYFNTQTNSGGLLTTGPKDPDHYKSVVTGYFLTRILSANRKHSFTFGYEPEVTKYITPLSGKLNSNRWDAEGAASYSEITNITYRLSRISSSDGSYMLFVYNLKRLDIEGNGRALTNILLSESNNSLSRSWVLKQSYFGSYPQSDNPVLNKRLKLEHIINLEDNSCYRFAYNENIYMPHRNVYGGQDWFGYNNGSSSGAVKHIFPNINELQQELPLEYKPGVSVNWTNSTTDICFFNGSNQSVNPKYTDSYSLKEIHYPTGGYSSFEYEPNNVRFYNDTYTNPTGDYWGGLRVKSIKNYSHPNELASFKEYKYYDGSATSKPKYWRLERYTIGENTYGKIILHSVPYNSIYAVNGDNLIYGKVTEFDGSGYIEHYFNSYKQYPVSFDSRLEYLYYSGENSVSTTHTAYKPSLDYSKEYGGNHFVRGQEYLTEYLDVNLTKVKSISRKYKVERTKTIYGMDVLRGYSNQLNDYDFCIYSHKVGRVLLESETVTDSPTNIQTTRSYEYNNWNMVKKSVAVNSDGIQTTTTTYYPDDINTGVYAEMVSKRMLNYPVEEIVTKKQSSQSVLNIYRKENNLILLDKVFSLSKNTGTVSVFNGTKYDDAYYEDVAIPKYDTYGNINEVRTKDGLYTTFLWSYKGMLPVAEIKNMTYEQVKGSLGESFITTLLEKTKAEASDFNKIQGLNSAANVFVTTYTQDPFKGITQIKGITDRSLAFNYDKAFRLSQIINSRGWVTDSYEYNYKNRIQQPTSSNNMTGLNIYTTGKYEVLSPITFYISDRGESSGNFTCNWTLKNSAGQTLSSTTGDAFATTVSEGGKLTVICSVKDNVSNVTTSLTGTFDTYYRPLELALPIVNVYYTGENAVFNAQVLGGSGKRTFVWVLKDSSGNILKSLSNNSSTFEHLIPKGKTGAMTISCTLTDDVTRETKSVVKTINVKYQPLAAQIKSDALMGLNIPETYILDVKGGSGNFSYNWSVTDPSGKVIHTSTSASFTYTFTVLGTMKPKCIIKDLTTGETKEVTGTSTVLNMIKIKNIQSHPATDEGLTYTITAEIWSSVKIATLYFSPNIVLKQGTKPTVTYSTSFDGASTYQVHPGGKGTVTFTVKGTKGTIADVKLNVQKNSSENVSLGTMSIGGMMSF